MAQPKYIFAIMDDRTKAWVPFPAYINPVQISAAVTDYLLTHPIQGGSAGNVDGGMPDTNYASLTIIDGGHI